MENPQEKFGIYQSKERKKLFTEDLVRKRAEHNECAIGSLEEISLHMLHIERIEHLDRWCRELQILLLHNNIIARIENLSRLKKLEYLNLSLNIIERVENLEGCESLNKLDLTLNFIGEITSVESLRNNYNLRYLTLVGNPCAQFEGYRDFVIHNLPQIQELDGKTIERSERTLAAQKIGLGLRNEILRQQNNYLVFRGEQRLNSPPTFEQRISELTESGITEEELIKKIWSEKSENSPEARVLMAKTSLRQQELRDAKPAVKPKAPRAFYNKEGRPLNINEAHLQFSMTEKENCLLLKLDLPRSVDTGELSTDVHPDHVRVIVKGHVFQLCLLEEVKADVAKAERSLASGSLLITMPLANENFLKSAEPLLPTKRQDTAKNYPKQTKREMLEIGPEKRDVDFTRIVTYAEDAQDFIDDPEVPPLEEDV